MKGLLKFFFIIIIIVMLGSSLFLVAIIGEPKELPLDIQQTIDTELTFNTYLNQMNPSKELTIEEQVINSILFNELSRYNNEFYKFNYLYVDLIDENQMKFYSNVSLDTDFFILDNLSTDFSGEIQFSHKNSTLTIKGDKLRLGRIRLPKGVLTSFIQGDEKVTRTSDYGEVTFYTNDLKMEIDSFTVGEYKIKDIWINDNAFTIRVTL